MWIGQIEVTIDIGEHREEELQRVNKRQEQPTSAFNRSATEEGVADQGHEGDVSEDEEEQEAIFSPESPGGDLGDGGHGICFTVETGRRRENKDLTADERRWTQIRGRILFSHRCTQINTDERGIE